MKGEFVGETSPSDGKSISRIGRDIGHQPTRPDQVPDTCNVSRLGAGCPARSRIGSPNQNGSRAIDRGPV